MEQKIQEKWPPEWLGWDKPFKFKGVLVSDKINKNFDIFMNKLKQTKLHTCPICGNGFINRCSHCNIVMGRRGFRKLGEYDG